VASELKGLKRVNNLKTPLRKRILVDQAFQKCRARAAPAWAKSARRTPKNVGGEYKGGENWRRSTCTTQYSSCAKITDSLAKWARYSARPSDQVHTVASGKNGAWNHHSTRAHASGVAAWGSAGGGVKGVAGAAGRRTINSKLGTAHIGFSHGDLGGTKPTIG